MADPVRLIERIRTRGANVYVDCGRLVVVNRAKLPPQALAMIADHAGEIAAALHRVEVGDDRDDAAFDERAAIIEFDGCTPREWAEQFAAVITRRRPAGISDLDWSWFLTRCGQIIDAGSEVSAP